MAKDRPAHTAPEGTVSLKDEIEVTSAMVEAGARVICECFSEAVSNDSSYPAFVEEKVFRAMDSSRFHPRHKVLRG